MHRKWLTATIVLLLIAGVGCLFFWQASRSTPPPPPPAKAALDPERVKPKVVFGPHIALFLAADGSLWGWGDNRFSLLLSGDPGVRLAVPQRFGTNTGWVDVAIGIQEGIAVKTDGNLWVWGRSHAKSSPEAPKRVTLEGDWSAVAAGVLHMLALKKDGTVWAWGYNKYGQLGNGTTIDRSRPEQMGTNTNWVAIAAADSASLGLRADGTLWGWGMQDMAQPETSAVVDTTLPLQIGSETNWVAIAAQDSLAVGRKADNSLWVWGGNAGSMMGRAKFRPRGGGLIQVGTERDWNDAAVAHVQGFGIRSDGTLWGWGYFSFDLLAHPGRYPGPGPKRIGRRNDWIGVWCNARNGAGLTADGRLWLWGMRLGEEPVVPFKDSMARKFGDFLRGYGVNTTMGQSQRLTYPYSSVPWPVLEFTNTTIKSSSRLERLPASAE